MGYKTRAVKLQHHSPVLLSIGARMIYRLGNQQPVSLVGKSIWPNLVADQGAMHCTLFIPLSEVEALEWFNVVEWFSVGSDKASQPVLQQPCYWVFVEQLYADLQHLLGVVDQSYLQLATLRTIIPTIPVTIPRVMT